MSYEVRILLYFKETSQEISDMYITGGAAAAGSHVESLGKSDLEVSVERLAAEGHPEAEHGGGHEAHRLAVHHEAVLVGERQLVRGAHALHPQLHLRPGPEPRVLGQRGLGLLCAALAVLRGEPGDVHLVEAVECGGLERGHHGGDVGNVEDIEDTADDTRPLLSAAALQLTVLTPDPPAAAAAGAPEVSAGRRGAAEPGTQTGTRVRGGGIFWVGRAAAAASNCLIVCGVVVILSSQPGDNASDLLTPSPAQPSPAQPSQPSPAQPSAG